MKIGEVPCCRFLLAILGIENAQNLAKYNKLILVFMQLTNSKRGLSWTFQPKSWPLCLQASLMFTGIHNQFPLLTMIKTSQNM